MDYSGAEVRAATFYHKDPMMMEYIEDPSKDMHRDMAAECFLLDPREVTKMARYCGKNMFVFPQFYGAYWRTCAANLWEAIEDHSLATKGGTPMKEHLEREGITHLVSKTKNKSTRAPTDKKSFEHHIFKVDQDFWGRRFKIYSKWKEDHYNRYLKRGWFEMLTGFRCRGLMQYNDVINYGTQGVAFHMLLWSLIELMKEIKKRELKTLIIGQIHDSIIFDLVPEERSIVLPLAREIMCERIRDHWSWINVGLAIEAELSPVNGNWFQKREVEIA